MPTIPNPRGSTGGRRRRAAAQAGRAGGPAQTRPGQDYLKNLASQMNPMQPPQPSEPPSSPPSPGHPPPRASRAQSKITYSKQQLLNILAPDADLPVELPQTLRFQA